MTPIQKSIRQCVDILDKFGAKMTMGGELEWYGVESSSLVKLDPQKIKEEILDKISECPALYCHTPYILNWEDISHYIKQKGFGPDEAIMKCAEHTMDSMIKAIKDEDDVYPKLLHALCMVRAVDKAEAEGIKVMKGCKEDGSIPQEKAQQFEIATETTDPEQVARWLTRLKKIIREESNALGIIADFRAKPEYTLTASTDTYPGNGLHIHYGMVDKEGNNLFSIAEESGNWKTSELFHLIADGCLEAIKQGGIIFTNSNDGTAMDRILLHANNSIDPKSLKSSTGKDGVIRVLNSSDKNMANLHQELRVPGGDCDPQAAVLLPLAGSVFALSEKFNLAMSLRDQVQFSQFGRNPNYDRLLRIRESICEDDIAEFKRLSKTVSNDLLSHDKNAFPTNLHTARLMLDQSHIGSFLKTLMSDEPAATRH